MKLIKRNKMWHVTHTIGGKRFRKALGTSNKGLAERRAIRYVAEFEQNSGETFREHPLSHIFKTFLEYSKGGSITQSTHNKYRNTIREFSGFLKLKKMDINKVRSSSLSFILIEEFKTHRLQVQGRKPKTVNNDVTSLKSIFNVAVKMKLTKESPFRDIRTYRVDSRKPVKFLTLDQISQLLRGAPEKDRNLIKFFLYTGVRYGEMLHLDWDDIDFQQRIIKVQTKEDWHTKSYQSRIIYMNEELFDLLLGLRARSKRGRLFPDETGNSFHHRLVKLAAKIGLPRVTPHMLRHTFASHLAMANVDPLTIKELLGHSELKTTQIYMHLAESHKRSAVNALNFTSQFDQQVPRWKMRSPMPKVAD